MKRVGIISTAALLLLLGTNGLAYARQEQQQKDEKQSKPEKQAKPEKQKDKKQQDQQPRAQQAKPAQQNRDQSQGQKQQQQRAQQQQQGERLSQQRQQQLVQQQQQRLVQYRQHLDQDDSRERERSLQLQQQKRMAQYRFQEEYLEHLRQQRNDLDNDRNHDYDRDPYFYTASSYRYNRGGRYYETNEYGANSLRQALNYGYSEGFRAGRADREDRWGSNYRDSYAYQDANYGYNGYYVDQDDYNYYFREGFRRGYEDGYDSRYQYGRYSNGSYIMLGPILSQILGLEQLR